MIVRRLQAALQWLFLRVGHLQPRLRRPSQSAVYHLARSASFLFWVVAASGLYLYAFFETGVADAHASVGADHNQWFAGGILRSLHRYASTRWW